MPTNEIHQLKKNVLLPIKNECEKVVLLTSKRYRNDSNKIYQQMHDTDKKLISQITSLSSTKRIFVHSLFLLKNIIKKRYIIH
jgi:hypothetical protein